MALHSNTVNTLLLRAIPSTPVQLHPGRQFVHQSEPNLVSQLFAFLQLPGSVSRWCFVAARVEAARRQASHMKINALVWDLPCSRCHTQQSSSSTPKSSIKKSMPLTNHLPHSTHTSAQPFQNTDFPNWVSGFWKGSSLVQEQERSLQT